MQKIRYWIIVASKDHVQQGVACGFTQACHGKASPLKRMHPGDWVVFYSSKQEYGKEEKCQCFTAIGQVKEGEVYQMQMAEGFEPFRRNVSFLPCQEISILPLISQLSFIRNKKSWGYIFRYGFFEINEQDFTLIASGMLEQSVKDHII
jgi:predicted RNA-binding protein